MSSLPNDVAHANAQMLGVLEAVQDRVDVLGPFAQLGQRFFENLERRQMLDEQAVHQLVDHARVAGEDAGQVRARRTQRAHTSSSDGWLKLNSSHSAALPPSESLTRLRFTSVVSGSGVWAIAASSRGAIAARKWRQRRVERKRIFSVASAIRF